MAEFQERRTSALAQWARSVAIFAAILLVLSGLGHRQGIVETVPFFWLLGIVLVLALASVILAIGGFVRLWEHGDRAGRASATALLVAALTLAPFLWGAYAFYRYPPLNDISTDLENPPAFSRLARQRSGMMNRIGPISFEVARVQLKTYPEVAGRRYDASVEQVLRALDVVLAAHGWTPLSSAGNRGGGEAVTIEALAPTPVMGFPVDAAIRVTPAGASTLVDMRLTSRYGRHDLGDGARRIVDFLADLDRELAMILAAPPVDEPASGGEEDAVD